MDEEMKAMAREAAGLLTMVIDTFPLEQQFEILVDAALVGDTNAAKGLTMAAWTLRNNARVQEFRDKIAELHDLWGELLNEEAHKILDQLDLSDPDNKMVYDAWTSGFLARKEDKVRWDQAN